MSVESQIERNVRATQPAGAAVAHFLADDEEPLKRVHPSGPGPPSALMLRFAGAGRDGSRQRSGTLKMKLAQQLVFRAADFDEA